MRYLLFSVFALAIAPAACNKEPAGTDKPAAADKTATDRAAADKAAADTAANQNAIGQAMAAEAANDKPAGGATDTASKPPPAPPAAPAAKPPAPPAEKPTDKLADARAHWSPAGRQWVAKMIEILPSLMCYPGSYFETCFSAGDQCKSIAVAKTNSCLAKNPGWVPRDVTADTGRTAGSQWGQCLGNELEQELRQRGSFNNTAHCNDGSFWINEMQQHAQRVLMN